MENHQLGQGRLAEANNYGTVIATAWVAYESVFTQEAPGGESGKGHASQTLGSSSTALQHLLAE